MVDKFTSISILPHVVSYMDTGEIEVYNTLHKYLEVEPSYRPISCSSTPVCRDMIWLVKIEHARDFISVCKWVFQATITIEGNLGHHLMTTRDFRIFKVYINFLIVKNVCCKISK